MAFIITSENLAIVAPELADEPQARIDLYADIAGLLVQPNRFGSRYQNALLLLTAHYLSLGSRGGNANEIASEKIGEVERTYSVTSNTSNDSDLTATPYGQLFMALRRTILVTPMVV